MGCSWAAASDVSYSGRGHIVSPRAQLISVDVELQNRVTSESCLVQLSRVGRYAQGITLGLPYHTWEPNNAVEKENHRGREIGRTVTECIKPIKLDLTQ